MIRVEKLERKKTKSFNDSTFIVTHSYKSLISLADLTNKA